MYIAFIYKHKCTQSCYSSVSISYGSPIEVRAFNDAMMQLKRVFIDPLGLSNRKYTR